jgi:hypothetical protein
MSTSVLSSEKPVLSTPLLIALVTLKGYQDANEGKDMYIEDLSRYLVDLQENNIDVSRIALSRTLDKYWSEDVAEFVSEGMVFGFLTQKSPLRFDTRCLQVCRKTLAAYLEDDEDLKPLVERAEEILKIKPELVVAA